MKRYGIRPDRRGFTVPDLFTGQPVVIIDVRQVGLSGHDAIELTKLLNKHAIILRLSLRQ